MKTANLLLQITPMPMVPLPHTTRTAIKDTHIQLLTINYTQTVNIVATNNSHNTNDFTIIYKRNNENKTNKQSFSISIESSEN